MTDIEQERAYWRAQAIALFNLDPCETAVDSLGRTRTLDETIDLWLASDAYREWRAEQGHPIDKADLN